ncbi:MAG TPA: TraR/DksA C4-type zinc finger protein [Candidatus Binatia bacterium]|jgi:RNA polymerase-binding transcription factor DksA
MNSRKKKIIDALSEELHQRRLAIVGGVDNVEGELKNITEEQEAELEEEAQKDRIATVLEHLSNRDRQALEEIDEAILRIVQGIYGKCLSCGRYIALARLRALPTTRLCIDCARAHEGKGASAGEEAAEDSGLPADLSLLDDEEIEAALNDMVRDAGNIDRDELHISSRDGVIHLEGTVPSERQHQMLTELLQDVAGIGDVVDHLDVQRTPWEKGGRSKRQSAAECPAGDEDETEDVTHARGDASVPYRPPTTPPPLRKPREPRGRGRRARAS